MSPQGSASVVGPWAREKLDALGRYLDFYTTALKNQRWRTIYVDAFAGGGRSAVRTTPTQDLTLPLEQDQIDAEQLEFIDGSPRVALTLANPFTRYIFIEPDAERAADLERVKAEYGTSRRIEVRRESAVRGIQWLVARNIRRETHRGLVFLDPFGAQLEWATVQSLADKGLFEVVINFALNMAIQRMLPNSGAFQPGWQERLTAYFGTNDWYSEVYEVKSGLLGSYVEKRSNYQTRLLELYRRRLKDAFGFVSQAKLIRNTRGVPLYYLLWAGPHRLGLKGANYILGMGERPRTQG
jgi:three-Cys-motif partner protein